MNARGKGCKGCYLEGAPGNLCSFGCELQGARFLKAWRMGKGKFDHDLLKKSPIGNGIPANYGAILTLTGAIEMDVMA